MAMDKELLKKKQAEYAKVLVSVGLGTSAGQTVVIEAPVDAVDFTRLCVAEAYAAGAKNVEVYWEDDYITLERFLKAEDDVFDEVSLHKKAFRNGYAEAGAAFLFLDNSDPNLLQGVDGERLARSAKARAKAFRVFRERETKNQIVWCIAAVPGGKWATTMFPELGEDEAVSLLWEKIFETVRVKGDGGAEAAWRAHTEAMRSNAEKLNRYAFRSIRYTNSLGTDLTVELPEHHVWAGGASVTPEGRAFVANMPTEEVFSCPKKTGVNGVVYASKPLSLNGTLVDRFYFVVKDGRIEEVHAEVGEKILLDQLSVDDGARYFGEVALVPYDSPISNQNILYFNTLFDENAACHIAFGAAYPECVEGGEEMTREELDAAGLNDSDTHIDFMVGTRDLRIVGTTPDGREIPVFENGNFAL